MCGAGDRLLRVKGIIEKPSPEEAPSSWAVLGRYDFINVVEAPDEQTIARISLELSSRGTTNYETLTAIPIDDFIAGI